MSWLKRVIRPHQQSTTIGSDMASDMALIRLYSQGGASFGTEHRERALALLLRKYGGVDYDKHWGTTVHLIDDGADTK